MRGPTFSSSWYRVAALTPRLRSHARLHRHTYRGETWWVMRDLSSDQVHRFSPAGYLMIGLMDGRRSVQDVWDLAVERLADDAPTQDEMIDLLARLHAADVLQCDVSPDTAEVLARHERIERKAFMSQWLSPLSWRLPLVDPERWLQVTRGVGRVLFGPLGALLWLAVVVPALVLGGAHWRDLSSNFLDTLLVPQNALLIWLVFPIVKVLHELGHAYAVKAYGGEVHDMGVMLLVFTPVPYVDASSASAFPNKWQRMIVGLAGMIVELFLAALALFVWLAAAPGLVRTLAYDVIMVAGLSTVLFNANPLIRYDGYYVLADLLEIPNLAARSKSYLGYLGERYVLGRGDAQAADATPSERAWFVTYGIASAVYRMLVMVGIVLFVMTASFYVGLALAVLMGFQWAVMPAFRSLKFLTGPRLRGVRGRALGVIAVVAAAAIALVGFVPVPLRSVAEGVVWIPEEAFVRAETEGFVDTVVAKPGARVQRGDLLVVSRDPSLDSRVAVLEARRHELEARYREQRMSDPVKAEIVREELAYVEAEVTRAQERRTALAVHSTAAGTFVIADPESLPGRFVKKGELLAYVIDLETLTVRTVVPQTAIDLVRGRTERVDVRLAERVAEARPAVLRREVPGATEKLPSSALGNQGGGTVGTDPRDPQGRTAVRKVFQVDLGLPVPDGLVNLGGRVYVRFDHGREPLVAQWYRQLRQLFLARFDV